MFRKREESPVEWRLAVLVDSSDELTAEGLTVELISKLGELRGVTVLAPHSSLTTRDAAGAIRNLGANAILECSLDGMNLQAKTEPGGFRGLTPMGTFDNVIQPAVEALSRFVGSSLGRLRVEEGRANARIIDRESYQLYLSGRAWFHRWSPDNLAQAAAHFEKVIERCPELRARLCRPRRHSGASGLLARSERTRHPGARPSLCVDGSGTGSQLRRRVLLAGRAGSHLNRDWAASEKLFRRALDANPSNALALNWLSIITLSTPNAL